MREPGTRTRQALLIALGAAGLAGANALTTGSELESSWELAGLVLEVLGAGEGSRVHAERRLTVV